MHRRSNGHIWSEHAKGRSQSTNDIMSGVGLGAESLEVVTKDVGPNGVTCKFDCSHCGRQTALITVWPELVAFFRGQKVKGATPTQQGVLMRVRCPCRRVNRLLWGWDEVHNYVTQAVRLRQVPPHVLNFGR